MPQNSLNRRCVHDCIEETNVQLFFIHLPFKNHPGKVDRWLEKLNRQKWKPDDHIKRYMYFSSVFRITASNNEYGFVHFSGTTSNFSITCVKIHNMSFKTFEMDQIPLLQWYNSFFRPLKVDGRGFLHRKSTFDFWFARPNIKMPHMRRTVSQSTVKCINNNIFLFDFNIGIFIEVRVIRHLCLRRGFWMSTYRICPIVQILGKTLWERALRRRRGGLCTQRNRENDIFPDTLLYKYPYFSPFA